MKRMTNFSTDTFEGKRKRAPINKASVRPSSPMSMLSPEEQILHLQRTIGNRAVTRLIQTGAFAASKKCVEGNEDEGCGQMPAKRDLDGRISRADGGGASPPAKVAGVDSFEVKWKKNTIAGRNKASLRLDYTAKFKKDASHDPALAEFRQNAGDKWEITDGPNKGASGSSPLADDNYSRADDTAGNSKSDVNFVSNDNPGWSNADMDDGNEIDYSFTAEQMIIDTSQANKVIAKRGPHTATIKGKHPRTYGDVPKTFS